MKLDVTLLVALKEQKTHVEILIAASLFRKLDPITAEISDV